MQLADVPNVLAVCSGKGGVGKTTVAADLAHAANTREGSVGLIDADISTPNSIGVLADGEFELGDQRLATGSHLVPPDVGGIQALSEELVLPDDVPINRDGAWRTQEVVDYIQNTDWAEDTHTVVIDTPPGTGSEVQTVVTQVDIAKAFVITTPHPQSQQDARRSHEMLSQFDVPHTGIVNMAYIPNEDLSAHVTDGLDMTSVDGVGENIETKLIDLIQMNTDDFPLFGFTDPSDVEIGAEIEQVLPYTTDDVLRRDPLGECLPAREVAQ